MGDFSRDTFDPSKHYGGVRLQQNVPVVDADWNERDDIRRYETRHFGRRFASDGVPQSSQAFQIGSAQDPANNFRIDTDANYKAAVYLAGGFLVRIDEPRDYRAQALFENPELAERWGVPVLPALTTPAADRTDLVYLDAWEREVDSEEDPDLIHPDVGIETAVRLRLEWVVRVSEGELPVVVAPGHAHVPLARLRRRAGEERVDGFEDLRDALTTTRNMYYRDGNVGVGGEPGPEDRFAVFTEGEALFVRETGWELARTQNETKLTIRSVTGGHEIDASGDLILQPDGGVGIGLPAQGVRAGFDVNGNTRVAGNLTLQSPEHSDGTTIRGLLRARGPVALAGEWSAAAELNAESPEFQIDAAPADGWMTAVLSSDSVDDRAELIAQSPAGSVRTRASTVAGNPDGRATLIGDAKDYGGDFGKRVIVRDGRVLLSDGSENLFLFARGADGQWREARRLEKAFTVDTDYGRYFAFSRDLIVTSGFLKKNGSRMRTYIRKDDAGDEWDQGEDIFEVGEEFGTAMTAYGEYVMILGKRVDSSFIYRFPKGSKTIESREPINFGRSVGVAMSADRALVAYQVNIGSYYLAQKEEAGGKLTQSWVKGGMINPKAGDLSSIGCGGRFAIIGAVKKKAAYIYEQDGENWRKVAELGEKTSGYGSAVDIDDRFAVVGAADNAVYVYGREPGIGTEWKLLLIHADRTAGFARDVSLDGSIAAVSMGGDKPKALILEMVAPGENSLRFPVRAGESVRVKLWVAGGRPTARLDYLPLGAGEAP